MWIEKKFYIFLETAFKVIWTTRGFFSFRCEILIINTRENVVKFYITFTQFL